MPNDEVTISQLPVGTLGNGSLFETSEVNGEGYASTKVAASDLGNYVNTVLQYAGLKTAVLTVVGAVNSVLAIFADEYNTTTYYNPGWYCIKDGVLYVCQNDTHGMWSEGAWTETTVDEALRSMKGEIEYFDLIKFNSDNVAAFHSTTTAYSKGDYCISDEDLILYRAKVDIPTGTAWDDTKWEAVTIGDELKSINDSRLDDLPVVTMPYSAVATFNTDRAVPLADVSCQIVAQQSGSGDPSPSNVRAISGKSVVKVSATGKNLCPYIEFGGLSQTTGEETSSSTTKRSGWIAVKSGESYTLSHFNSGDQMVLRMFWYDEGQTYIDNELTAFFRGSVTLTIPSNVCWMRFQTSGASITETNCQVEHGTTATTYQAFGKIATIPLGSTVYGGTVDVDNGTLTVTHARVDMGTLTYSSASSGAARFTASLPETPLAPASANDKADLICDTYPTSSSMDIYNGTVDGRVAIHTSGAFWVRDTNYSTSDAIKAALSGHYIVYALATPKVIPLNGWGTVALSTLSWELSESSSSETHKVFYTLLTGKANGQTNVISGDYSLSTSSLANMADKSIRGYANSSAIVICDNSCATVEAFVATLTGKYIAYELASPTSSTRLYEPTELIANNGNNSLWADTGDTSVAYRESAQKYIDENTGLSRAKVYSLNLSQGGAWINTGVDMTNVDTLMFERNDNSDINLQVVIKKSQIAVYTGGSDVYTTIYAQGGKPLNVRIYNNILYASYNGTGAATYVTNVYALKDVF